MCFRCNGLDDESTHKWLSWCFDYKHPPLAKSSEYICIKCTATKSWSVYLSKCERTTVLSLVLSGDWLKHIWHWSGIVESCCEPAYPIGSNCVHQRKGTWRSWGIVCALRPRFSLQFKGQKSVASVCKCGNTTKPSLKSPSLFLKICIMYYCIQYFC